MSGIPDEKYLESFIEQYLTSQPIKTLNGKKLERMEYVKVSPDEYERNKDLCMIPSEMIAFLKDTQPEEYQYLLGKVDGNEEKAQRTILNRLDFELKSGTLHLLHCSTFDAGMGAKFCPIFFKPANNKTPEQEEWYNKNRLAIVRQLHYSKKNKNSIDTVIFINGIPIFTIELKNTLTGQTHINAIKQYMQDRKIEGEKLLEFKRCLAHFAVGTEQVYMTTHLANEDTHFLPFNMRYANEGLSESDYHDYKISYFWEDVLRRDSIFELIQSFIFLNEEKKKYYNKDTNNIEEKDEQTLIFPRYHQRRAIRRIVDDVKKVGVGHRYLIEHSAGSGKSYTISWLAFKLSGLYQHDDDDKPMFDSTLVINDRCILDRQAQKNLQQFYQEEGEVAYVAEEEHKSSKDLQTFIENRRKIIVTTLQKFSVIADTIKHYPDRRYAVIIDEAHSSQTGESARDMRKSLSLQDAEKFDTELNQEDVEDKLNKCIETEILRKSNHGNISFFAFTATPKPKTIEIFAERHEGEKRSFDTYTMEQAIKEGFILDVLHNYMSFKRYYKLVKSGEKEDKLYAKKKAIKLLSSYVDLQDTAIERKARIMIEHFVSQTAREIEGEARAMLVTRSRLHAVRFKLKFDEIMQEMHLPYGCLVAFSGTVHDDETDEDYTEFSMNKFIGRVSIPDALKLPKYRILIVANKFQTGFDEPKLHTMFVDKKLGGTNTVQTLSRLNRTMKGKNDTMVLDFVNKTEDILSDFQDYYGENYMAEEDETDPNSLYDLKSKVLDFKAFRPSDVNDFARYYYPNSEKKEKIYGVVNRVCDYIRENLDNDSKDLFRKTARQYTNLYKFLSQIITFTDVELDKLYVFLLAIIKALPYEKEKLPYEILSEAKLDSYKLQYQYTADLKLESADKAMVGLKPGGVTNDKKEEYDLLSKIIKTLNETYGLDLTDEDKVDMEKMRDRLSSNDELMSYFNPDNTRDNVKDKFDERLDSELLEFINTKLELYNKLSDDKVNKTLKRLWFNDLYDRYVRGL